MQNLPNVRSSTRSRQVSPRRGFFFFLFFFRRTDRPGCPITNSRLVLQRQIAVASVHWLELPHMGHRAYIPDLTSLETQVPNYLRTLVPDTIQSRVFGVRNLYRNVWVLGSSGIMHSGSFNSIKCHVIQVDELYWYGPFVLIRPCWCVP